MDNQIVDLSKFKENLQQKIREDFANIIPKEALSNFIEVTIKEFEEKEIKQVILETLRAHVKEVTKQTLMQASYGQWDSVTNQQKLAPEFEKLLADAAPAMFQEVMRDIARMTLQNMRY